MDFSEKTSVAVKCPECGTEQHMEMPLPVYVEDAITETKTLNCKNCNKLFVTQVTIYLETIVSIAEIGEFIDQNEIKNKDESKND